MCGILGIVNISNREPIASDLLETMVTAMAHRGPDGVGVWIQPDGQCGLAHRRLSIVDLSEAGHQPMSTDDEMVWVSFNGEIYNYPVLREQFESDGHRFRSDSDTEIILHLYRRYGDHFIDYLDGDFGIGLWDCDKQCLILARDRAGVKPVYYSYLDGRLIFSSEIKALLKYPNINKSIDLTSFYHYLSFLVVPPPKTLIKGIFKLEAASVLKLEARKGESTPPKKYWLPIPNIDNQRSFSEFDDEIEALFSVSVKKRLMSDVPVGVLFSGGVDSTLNLCSFSNLIVPDKVKTFTIGMENSGDFHDDSIIAQDMARRLGSEHHAMYISEADLLATAKNLTQLQDEPISDPVAVPLYFVTKMAKEHGVTVLQAGEGADELFCGYSNYTRFINFHDKLWQPLSRLPKSFSGFAAKLLQLSRKPLHRKICDVLLRCEKGQELFMSSAVAYYEQEKQAILSPELRHLMSGVDSFDVIAPYYERMATECPDATFLQVMTFIELQLRLPELLLMRADKMSMANSLEIRVPFLDRDIMDFSLRVPDTYKLRNGISKEPIKNLASKHVSRKDVYRPKTGFGVPIQSWFNGSLGDAFLDMLTDHTIGADEFLDTSLVIERLQRGPRTVNEAFQLWVLYNFLVWKEALVL